MNVMRVSVFNGQVILGLGSLRDGKRCSVTDKT